MTDRLRLLWVLPYPPLPVTTGGRRRVGALLRRLSARHEVFLHCNLRSEQERDALRDLDDLTCKTVGFMRGGKWSIRAGAGWLLHGKPYLAALNEAGGRVADSIRTSFAGCTFDCIHVEHYYMLAAALSALPQTVPILLSEHGIEYLVAARHAERQGGPLRVLWTKEVRQTKRLEEWAWRRADRMVTVSDDDRRIVSDLVPSTDVTVVPNAVELDEFPFAPGAGTEGCTVAFVGTYRFFGNVEAARWLLESVMPKVRETVPKARLLLIGEQPPDCLRVNDAWVSVPGWVPSIPEALGEAAVMAVPLWAGSGTKLKVLEAMALGIPVVSTPLGVEGLPVEDGRHVVLADNPLSFAKALTKLLIAPRLGAEIAGAARQLVERHFSWDRATSELEMSYERMISAFAARRTPERSGTT